MRALCGFGALAACLLHAAVGSACVRLTTWSLVEQATPAASSAGVPLNAPILVRFTSVTSVDADSTAPPGYSVPAAILLTAADAAPLSLHKLDLVYGGAPPYGPAPELTAFVPDAPLLPDTEYTVVLGQDSQLSDPNAEPAPTTWTFTTGSEARAALRWKGELSVSFEAGLDPHMDCEPPLNTLCGGAQCTQNGFDNVTKARVQMPAAFDGYADQFLKGRVTVRDAAGDESQLTGSIAPDLVAGQGSEALMTVPLSETGQTYVPCFTFVVSDARGDEASTSWCADAPFPAPAPSSESPPSSPGQHTSSACSISALAPGSGPTHGGPVVALLALLWMCRPGRSKARTNGEPTGDEHF